jgi:hypothetical protein
MENVKRGELCKVWKNISKEVETGEGYLVYIDPDMDDNYLETSHDPVNVFVSEEDKRKYVYLSPVPGESWEEMIIITVGYD